MVMRDPTASQERLWVMTGGDTSDQLLQYDSELDLRYHLVSRCVNHLTLFNHKAKLRMVTYNPDVSDVNFMCMAMFVCHVSRGWKILAT